MKKKPVYVDSLKQLEAYTGITARRLQDHLNREGSPGKTKAGRYNVAAWVKFVHAIHKNRLENLTKSKAAGGKGSSGEHQQLNELKCRELELKCQTLEEKLLILRGENIPMTEHAAELGEHLDIVVSVFAQFQDEVDARLKNPRMSKRLKEIQNRARAALRSKLQEAVENASEFDKGK